MPVKGTKKTFGEILRTEDLVLVDFTAEWCGPCKMLKPVIDELKSDLGEKLMILKLDVDKNPEASAAYNIQGVPTLILFKKGKSVWRNSGLLSLNLLKSNIERFMN